MEEEAKEATAAVAGDGELEEVGRPSSLKQTTAAAAALAPPAGSASSYLCSSSTSSSSAVDRPVPGSYSFEHATITTRHDSLSFPDFGAGTAIEEDAGGSGGPAGGRVGESRSTAAGGGFARSLQSPTTAAAAGAAPPAADHDPSIINSLNNANSQKQLNTARRLSNASCPGPVRLGDALLQPPAPLLRPMPPPVGPSPARSLPLDNLLPPAAVDDPSFSPSSSSVLSKSKNRSDLLTAAARRPSPRDASAPAQAVPSSVPLHQKRTEPECSGTSASSRFAGDDCLPRPLDAHQQRRSGDMHERSTTTLDWLLTPGADEDEDDEGDDDEDDKHPDGSDGAYEHEADETNGGLSIAPDDDDDSSSFRLAQSTKAAAVADGTSRSIGLDLFISIPTADDDDDESVGNGSSFLPTQIGGSASSSAPGENPLLSSSSAVVRRAPPSDGRVAAAASPSVHRHPYLHPSSLDYLPLSSSPLLSPSHPNPKRPTSFLAVVLSLTLRSFPSRADSTRQIERGDVALWDGRSEVGVVLWEEEARAWCTGGGLRRRDVVLFESPFTLLIAPPSLLRKIDRLPFS